MDDYGSDIMNGAKQFNYNETRAGIKEKKQKMAGTSG